MTAMKSVRRALLAASLLLPSVATAETERLVESARVRLDDVVLVSDPELASIDLGPAPPPGSSRLFGRDEILRLLEARGGSLRGKPVPAAIRVRSAGKRFSADELEELVDSAVRAALPPGATVKELRVSRGVLTSPRIEVGTVRIPRLVRRAGPLTVTASVDLTHDGEVTERIPVTVALELDARAARSLVQKGSRVDLVIARGPARISASAVALDDVELGEVRSFRVSSTNKVLRARLESPTLAVVVTP